MKIKIMRCGNRIAVDSLDPQLIAALLDEVTFTIKEYVFPTYAIKRQQQLAGGGRAGGVQIVRSQLGGLDHKQRFCTAAGFYQRISRLLRKHGFDEIELQDLAPHANLTVFEPVWDRLWDSDIELRPGQEDFLVKLFSNDMGRFDVPTAWGKAQPLTSLVQTPRGPKPMGAIQVGDEVCGADGEVNIVQAVHPQGCVPVFRVTFADGDFVECCEDHLWEVDSSKLGFAKPKVIPLRELANTYLSPKGDRYYSIRTPRPLVMPVRRVPIPAYLMGLLLGDGCFRRIRTPGFSTADAQIVNLIRRRLRPGYKLSPGIGKGSYTIARISRNTRVGKNFYETTLKKFGLWGHYSWQKFIPELYLYNSAAVRLEVLRGLLDTDGTVETSSKVTYSTSSPRLAAQVKWLVESLGGIAVVYPKLTKRRLSYIIGIRMFNSGRLFRLSRKKSLCRLRKKYTVKRVISDIRYVGESPAQCITVSSSSGLYLTDHCVVTHNSFLIGLVALLLPKARIDVVTKSIPVLKQRIYPELCRMVPNVGLVGGGKNITDRRVMCYSAMSLRHSSGKADILLADESHQLASDKISELLGRYTCSRNYGLSASHDMRLDNKDFRNEAVFGPIIFSRSYEQSVQDGNIVPIEVRWRDCVLDHNPAGSSEGLVERKRWGVWRNDQRNKLVAIDARRYVADEQVLITVETLEHAIHLKQLLPEFTLVYSVNGMHPRRRRDWQHAGLLGADEPLMTEDRLAQLVSAFERNQLKKVICTTVWNVGVDFRDLMVLIRADAGGSPINDIQIPGRTSRRGTRGDKSVGIIHDYLDQFDRGFRAKATGRYHSYAALRWTQVLPPGRKMPATGVTDTDDFGL